MTMILTKTECDAVRTNYTVTEATVFTFSGDSGAAVSILFNGAFVGYITKNEPQFEATAIGEYTLVTNTGCPNARVDASPLSVVQVNVESNSPTQTNCNGDEVPVVYDPCVVDELTQLQSRMADLLVANTQSIDDTSTIEQAALASVLAATVDNHPPDEEEYVYTGNRVGYVDPNVYSPQFGLGYSWHNVYGGQYSTIDQVIKYTRQPDGTVTQEVKYLGTRLNGQVVDYTLQPNDIVADKELTLDRKLRAVVVNIKRTDGLTWLATQLEDRPDGMAVHIKSITMELINTDQIATPATDYGYALMHSLNPDPARDKIYVGYKHTIQLNDNTKPYVSFLERDMRFQAFGSAQWVITVTYEETR